MDRLSQLPSPFKKSVAASSTVGNSDIILQYSCIGTVCRAPASPESVRYLPDSPRISNTQPSAIGCHSRRTPNFTSGRPLADSVEPTNNFSASSRRSVGDHVSAVSGGSDVTSPNKTGNACRLVGVSSAGDKTPEVYRKGVVDETGNKRRMQAAAAIRGKKLPAVGTPPLSNRNFKGVSLEVAERDQKPYSADLKPVASNDVTVAADRSPRRNFDVTGQKRNEKRIKSPLPAALHDLPLADSYLIDDSSNAHGHRKAHEDINTYKQLTEYQLTSADPSDVIARLLSEVPSPPLTDCDVIADRKSGYEASTNGSGNSNGGSPIYHELDPPGVVYRFPPESSSNNSGSNVQHTYQSIAEIRDELEMLKMKAAAAANVSNTVASTFSAKGVDKKSKNISLDDQILIADDGKVCPQPSKNNQGKQQQRSGWRSPLSIGHARADRSPLPRAKSVQDLGNRNGSGSCASGTSGGSSKQQSTSSKLSLFSRIRFSKKSSSSSTATKASAAAVAAISPPPTPTKLSLTACGSRSSSTGRTGQTMAATATDSFNSVSKTSTAGGVTDSNDVKKMAIAVNDSFEHTAPSFSTFTGRSARRAVGSGDVTSSPSAISTGSTKAMPDSPYSVVYIPRRSPCPSTAATVSPPPRNSSLNSSVTSPTYGSRHSAGSLHSNLTGAYAHSLALSPAVRDTPSPAGVALSIPTSAPASNSKSVATKATEPLYRQKFLKLTGGAGNMSTAENGDIGMLHLHSSNSLSNLLASVDSTSNRSPLSAGPLSSDANLYLSRSSKLAENGTGSSGYFVQVSSLSPARNTSASSVAFSYEITSDDDRCHANARRPVGGSRRHAAAGQSPCRNTSGGSGSHYTSPSCGVRMAEMRGVARRMTSLSSPRDSSTSSACQSSSPRWLPTSHAPTPIPSPGLSASRLTSRLFQPSVFQFQFPTPLQSVATTATATNDLPNSQLYVREFRDQSSQTTITIGSVSATSNSSSSSNGGSGSSSVGLFVSPSSAAPGTSGSASRFQMQTIEEEDQILDMTPTSATSGSMVSTGTGLMDDVDAVLSDVANCSSGNDNVYAESGNTSMTSSVNEEAHISSPNDLPDGHQNGYREVADEKQQPSSNEPVNRKNEDDVLSTLSDGVITSTVQNSASVDSATDDINVRSRSNSYSSKLRVPSSTSGLLSSVSAARRLVSEATSIQPSGVSSNETNADTHSSVNRVHSSTATRLPSAYGNTAKSESNQSVSGDKTPTRRRLSTGSGNSRTGNRSPNVASSNFGDMASASPGRTASPASVLDATSQQIRVRGGQAATTKAAAAAATSSPATAIKGRRKVTDAAATESGTASSTPRIGRRELNGDANSGGSGKLPRRVIGEVATAGDEVSSPSTPAASVRSRVAAWSKTPGTPPPIGSVRSGNSAATAMSLSAPAATQTVLTSSSMSGSTNSSLSSSSSGSLTGVAFSDNHDADGNSKTPSGLAPLVDRSVATKASNNSQEGASHPVSTTTSSTVSADERNSAKEFNTRLASALMRVEQGPLSEKTRMLLAKISVARSASACSQDVAESAAS